jgi:hypothetical protein
MVPLNDLVTVDDLARRWNMSVGQGSNIVCGKDGRRKSKFPQPLVGRGTRAVWLLEDAEKWYQKHMPKSRIEARRASQKSRKKPYVNQPLGMTA